MTLLQAVRDRLRHTVQLHQQRDVAVGLPLGFGQVQRLLEARLAFQHVKGSPG